MDSENGRANYRGTQPSLFRPVGAPSADAQTVRLADEKALAEMQHALEAAADVAGMPVGSNDDILRLSLPPYYTACPNPFITAFTNDRVSGEEVAPPLHPLADDVSVGKNDPLYFAHYYSTKVPPHAIVPYILHFTQPGQIVFDGFAGTGMTGVAAQLCADAPSFILKNYEAGARAAILSDLSPTATFIAAMTNCLGTISRYWDELEGIVDRVALQYQYLLKTCHIGWRRGETDPARRQNSDAPHADINGHIQYTVWSDVFECAECGRELVFWDLVYRGPGQPGPDQPVCPNCGLEQTVRSLKRIWVTRYDYELGHMVQQAKQVPVLINYSVGTKRFEKRPDEADLRLIEQLDEGPLPISVPIAIMPAGMNTAQPKGSHGFTYVHHFFSRRNLILLGALWNEIMAIADPLKRNAGLYLLTGMIQRVCRLNRYMPVHDRHVGPLSGTLYVSQLTAEIPATNYALDRLADLRRCSDGPTGQGVIVSTQSATDLRNVPTASVDYIFTDPPFGGNLNYSELNALVEAWIKVRTATENEAIVNEVQKKGLSEYQSLMTTSFKEFYRILKPGHWITVEFHNSQNAVWRAIQESLGEAGFIVADVQTLDKQKGTTKQLSYSSAVKQDLIISAYRPNDDLEARFNLEAGSEEGVWDFVRSHLQKLPVFVEGQDNQGEVITERLPHLLFDRMVAFHVHRGVGVPLSASEFYGGLNRKYPPLDGMHFLDEQVAEYERKRMAVREIQQLQIFVSDESSARLWLRQQLLSKPSTLQELHPAFVQQLRAWLKHEVTLELADLLEQNFLQYRGDGPIPAQIVAWLKKSADLRALMAEEGVEGEDGGLTTQHKDIIARARDRWYVPDPNKAIDLEKVRLKGLLREFGQYLESKGKLKQFRTEAVKAGFAQAWQDRDFRTILQVAERLPESVLQEDPDLLMYYDAASLRA